MKISVEDNNKVTQILGRPALGLNKILCWNKNKDPAVLEVLPWVENRPFPTIYWLCCPLLKKEISKIEAQGYIKNLDNKQTDIFWEKLSQNHMSYNADRNDLLKQVHPQWRSEDYNKTVMLESTGIGGIKEFKSIKCLHLHYAHYLATKNNIVGETLARDYPHLLTLAEFA